MKVFLDTNFLVLPFEERIDIFDEIIGLVEAPEIIVLEEVLGELKKIKPKLYNSVLDLLKLKKVKIVKSNTKSTRASVDDLLLTRASSEKGAIATLDRELKQKALKQGVPIISVRGNKLEMRW